MSSAASITCYKKYMYVYRQSKTTPSQSYLTEHQAQLGRVDTPAILTDIFYSHIVITLPSLSAAFEVKIHL